MAKRLPDPATTPSSHPSHKLVVGDVVLVEAGDVVPADGDIIEASPRSMNRRSPGSRPRHP